MANGNGNKLANGLSPRAALVIAVISAVVGGVSGPILLVRFGGEGLVRPDPFTGADGAALKQRVTTLSREVQQHLSNHPDIVNRFDRRIATLEAQYAIILRNQDRIIQRLDKLNGQ